MRANVKRSEGAHALDLHHCAQEPRRARSGQRRTRLQRAAARSRTASSGRRSSERRGKPSPRIEKTTRTAHPRGSHSGTASRRRSSSDRPMSAVVRAKRRRRSGEALPIRRVGFRVGRVVAGPLVNPRTCSWGGPSVRFRPSSRRSGFAHADVARLVQAELPLGGCPCLWSRRRSQATWGCFADPPVRQRSCPASSSM